MQCCGGGSLYFCCGRKWWHIWTSGDVHFRIYTRLEGFKAVGTGLISLILRKREESFTSGGTLFVFSLSPSTPLLMQKIAPCSHVDMLCIGLWHLHCSRKRGNESFKPCRRIDVWRPL